MAVLLGIIRSLLDFEDSSVRFENFCLELYNESESVTLVPTSRSWDLARDGRRISTSSGRRLAGVLCATLSARLDGKIKADIKRLKTTTETRVIVYCSSRGLSERECAALEAEIRTIYQDVESVRVLGQHQIAALAEAHEDILRKHYAAEIANIEQALLRPVSEGEPELVGLRLALLTQTGDDARELRTKIAQRLVLESLQANGASTAGSLAGTISAQLHLGRSMSGAYIGQILSQLSDQGLVAIQNKAASLTTEGERMLTQIPAEASNRLLEGRNLIREEIRRLSGHILTDEHYDQVWNTLQDGLSVLFYSHGLNIVTMVNSLMKGEMGQRDHVGRRLLEELGDRVLPVFSERTQGEEVRQAIIDVFFERHSLAFQWLTQICTVYVMMCSLGFETFSNKEVAAILTGYRLVADSDVLLSFLCEAEDNHPEVTRIIAGWKELGGRLQFAAPVLEELAYHAWISENDYRGLSGHLSDLSDIDAAHLIANAFVRSFRKLSPGKESSPYWNSYISQFRGETEWDYRKIADILRDEHGFETLPEASEEEANLASEVEAFLNDRFAADAGTSVDELPYKRKDKSRRDGLLVASVATARNSARRSGASSRLTILLSSSRALKAVDEAFRNKLGEPAAVLAPAALGCLLVLTPGIRMGLETLRGVLFDVRLSQRLTDLERYAYRVIALSEEYDLPWSKRITLKRQLGEKLISDAKAKDLPRKELQRRVLTSEDPQYSAQVVVDALNRIAAPKASEMQIESLREENRRLKEELEAARRPRGRSTERLPARRPRKGK